MKKIIYILLYTLVPIFPVIAQVVGNCTAPYNTPESLVEILVGEGVEYSNVTFSGFDCSAGYFNGTSNLDFQTGLVMATDGLDAITPGGFGIGGGGAGSDSDLEEQLEMVDALNTNLNNLIILEFDFIPNSDEVTFNYIFASQEYPSFTCSQYNDIFGFFLSGPGISGPFTNNAVNIALVPDPNDPTQYTTTPVIINTVNSGISSYTDSSPCDDIDPNWQDNSIYYTENNDLSTVNYPGFVTLHATANVTACITYHMKLAIADVADGGVNSAVFLQENSFNSFSDIEYVVESNTANIFNPNSPFVDNIYEGCGDASITFERPPGIGGDFLIYYNLFGSSTLNLDYTLSNTVNNQVVILAGDDEAIVTIGAINDGISDDAETVLIETLPLDYGCFEIQPVSIQFTIYDQPEFSIETDNLAALCSDDEVELNVVPVGGMGSLMAPPFAIPPYTYQWIGLGAAASQIVNPTETTEYCVEVFDVCGQQAQTCMTIILEDSICDEGELLEDCMVELVFDYTLTNDHCDQGIGSATLVPLNGLAPYSYNWGNGFPDTPTASNLNDGEYNVLVTDSYGCVGETTVEIINIPGPSAYFDSSFDTVAYNLGLVEFLNFSSSEPSTVIVTNYWNFGEGTFSEEYQPTNVFDQIGVYNVELTVTDSKGCVDSYFQEITVIENFLFPEPIGCTYVNALNYDETAIVDDGSCFFEFNVTFEAVTTITNVVSIYNIYIVNLVLGASEIAVGDLIGVFYILDGELVCGGYIVYDGSNNMEIALIGDDPTTPEIEGFTEGQEIIWIIQQVETETNYLIDVVTEAEVFTADTEVNILLEEVDLSVTLGCTDPIACNYNPEANLEDGGCKYPVEYIDCYGNCINDIDVDGECDEVDYDDGIGIDEVDEDVLHLIKMIDVLGREQKEHKKGMFLFYIYENGKVEKRVIH